MGSEENLEICYFIAKTREEDHFKLIVGQSIALEDVHVRFPASLKVDLQAIIMTLIVHIGRLGVFPSPC